MTSGRFKPYDPHVKPYYVRRTNDEWEEHRLILTRMHNNHFTRRAMIKALDARGFEVSSSQLASQLKKWNLATEVRHVVSETTDDAQQYVSAVDGKENDPVDVSNIGLREMITPWREVTTSSNTPQSVDSSVEGSNKAAGRQAMPSAIPLSDKPVSTSDKIHVRVSEPETHSSRLNQTGSNPKMHVDYESVKSGPMLRRTQALRDLAQILLQDTDFEWNDTAGNYIDKTEANYSQPDFLEPTLEPVTVDILFPVHPTEPNSSETRRPNTSGNSSLSSDTLVSQKNDTPNTSTCVDDLDSPMRSPSSLLLLPDFESVFGTRFSNVDTSAKPKTTVIERETSLPKPYSLRLRDRIAKNSPDWDFTFRDTASAGAIVRQLSTITEPWCTSFPTTCCCHSLFLAKESFAQSPELYKILMEQSPIHKLRYVMALLGLAETRPTGLNKEVLKGRLREALEFYLKQCTRADVKNNMASTILHRLLKVSESVLDGEYSVTTRLSTRSLSSTSLQTSALLEKIFKSVSPDKHSTNNETMPTTWFQECADNAITLDFAGLSPNKTSSLNQDGGQCFDNRPWAFNRDDSLSASQDDGSRENATSEHLRPIFDGTFLTTTATSIAIMLQQQHASVPIKGVSSHGPSDYTKVFSALGLMIALEFSANAAFLSSAPGPISDPAFWTSEMHKFVYTFIENLSQDADCADKFRKAYWLARTDQISSPDGKNIHTGPCKASREWSIFSRNIHDFDEDRPWIERQFLARRLSLPRDTAKEIVVGDGDHMSIHSESSATSFDQFQATAVRLQVGRVPSARTFRTTSSNRMSVESHLSWQLERVLEISDGGSGGVMDMSPADEEQYRSYQSQNSGGLDVLQPIVE